MMRHHILQLHESHQGSVRTKQRARVTVYWPGIDSDIDDIVLACKQCQDCLPPNPRESIILKPKPSRPFQEVAGNFCSYAGQDFLMLVDWYSDWSDIPMGHNTTTPQFSNSHFAAQGCQMSSGLIKGLNSRLNHSRTSPKHGDFSTSHVPTE